MERKKKRQSRRGHYICTPVLFSWTHYFNYLFDSFTSPKSERTKICGVLNLIILKKEKTKGKFDLGRYFCLFSSFTIYTSKFVLNKLKRLKSIAIAI